MAITAPQIRLSDYGLVGQDSAAAIEKGLAEAAWYASPVPWEKMRELLRRKDGLAIRDSIIWFALILSSGIGPQRHAQKTRRLQGSNRF